MLQGQRIYGIVPLQNDNKFLIFGGKQFATIILDNADDNVKISQLYEKLICDDWIHASVWSSCTDVVLLTAHNVVQVNTLAIKLRSTIQIEIVLSMKMF